MRCTSLLFFYNAVLFRLSSRDEVINWPCVLRRSMCRKISRFLSIRFQKSRSSCECTEIKRPKCKICAQRNKSFFVLVIDRVTRSLNSILLSGKSEMHDMFDDELLAASHSIKKGRKGSPGAYLASCISNHFPFSRLVLCSARISGFSSFPSRQCSTQMFHVPHMFPAGSGTCHEN